MMDVDIKEYLSKVGIRKVAQLDAALIETFGQKEGEGHIDRMTELFDMSEKRLVFGDGSTLYLHRQQELVDYLNQSLQMSLLASSFYDRVFFRRVMEYLVKQDSYWTGDIWDIGCGNGILTCFLALRHSDSAVTGLELSENAVLVAKELAERLQINNVQFTSRKVSGQRQCDALLSCRTVHENVIWKPFCEEPKPAALPMEEHVRRHEAYARELASLVRAGGHLVSVERYEADSAYAGLICALEHAGFCQLRGTHMQFSCKDGDKMAAFEAMVFQKG